MKKTINIYGVGGAGLNTVLSLNLPSESAGFPLAKYTLVDTSRSNMPSKLPANCTPFIIHGVDGTGKDAAFAREVSRPEINNILLKSPAEDFNIVVFGASGGSGAGIGPLILAELIRRGRSVIGMCIISTDSAKETKNAYETLAHLHNLSTNILKKPIVCGLYTNCVETPWVEVDKAIDNDLRAVAMLVSGTNKALDSEDIHNWINYTEVTSVPPQLTDLMVFIKKTGEPLKLPTDLQAISVANVLTDTADTTPALGQLYSCGGLCSEEAQTATTHGVPTMHFVITNQYMGGRIAELRVQKDQYQESERQQTNRDMPSFDDIKFDESGCPV